MKTNNNKLKYLLSTAALAGMLLAQNGMTIAHADKFTIKSGDTLSSLALQKGTTVNQLAQINHIQDPNHIQAGQVIDDGNNNTDSQSGVQYVIVKAGDTVSSLASQYHTTISQIAKDNNLDSNYTIIVGQKLRISSDDGQNTSTDTTLTTNNTQTNSNANYQVQNGSSASQPSTTQGSVANNGSYSSPVSGNEASAKAWIAAHESGGNYNARNGQYIGKYQLSSSYLGGDYSPANQERVADQYVSQRYGSWSAAQQHWQANGWY